jgi:hypothetical protein
MKTGRKIMKISVYMPVDLAEQLDEWRKIHMPLEPKSTAILRIIRDRVEAEPATTRSS